MILHVNVQPFSYLSLAALILTVGTEKFATGLLCLLTFIKVSLRGWVKYFDLLQASQGSFFFFLKQRLAFHTAGPHLSLFQ